MSIPATETGPDRLPTRIHGLDAITEGGLPIRGVTLISGGPGTGKSVLALNIVANALRQGDACVVVSFEESPDDILANTRAFDWSLEEYLDRGLSLIDARPRDDVEVAGGFDIGGLLAILADLVEQRRPSWIVLDGIDQLAAPQPDAGAIPSLSEIRRLQRWLSGQGIAGLLTAKESPAHSHRSVFLDDLHYLFSTTIILSGEIVGRRLSRKLRIAKYRGSDHVADEVPLVIDRSGVNIPYYGDTADEWRALTERISTGVPRLDTLVGGGYFRGSGVLISGEPGTSKTSLAAAFAEAAAARGERVLFISFDEAAPQIVRNVRSIGIDLQPHIDTGRLVIRMLRAGHDLVEHHYLEVLRLIGSLQPDCLVIDPVSALLKAGGDATAYLSLERLLDTVKSRGISTLMTSLVDHGAPEDTTAAHVSTIADTWIVLKNQVLNGERNRALSIVKSRGTRHSNQMRELILSDKGIELADVYAYGSEVLLGTARIDKEHQEALDQRREAMARERRRKELEHRIAQAEARRREVEQEVEELREDLALEKELWQAESADRSKWQHDVLRSRRSDSQDTGARTDEEDKE